MSENHKIIRIFVGSPSGLDKERKAVWEVVEELNRRNGDHWKIHFKVVGWEETVGGNRRPQSIINRDLETCDYFIGILHEHWGSPPQTDEKCSNKYTSGFEEEYELAQKLFTQKKMDDIFLFLKDISSNSLRDIGPSLRNVLDFIEKVKLDKNLLYKQFESLESFKKDLGDALTDIGWKKTTSHRSSSVVAPRNISNNSLEPSNTNVLQEKYLFPEQVRSFIDLIKDKNGDYDSINSEEVARFRLISSYMHRSGNDQTNLGVHDANLLFRHRATLNLSTPEKSALLRAGLQNFSNQNAPFWYWVDRDITKFMDIISYSMHLADEDEIAASALKIANIFGYDICYPTLNFKRNFWIEKLFKDKKDHKLQNAIEKYFINWATEDDIEILEKIRNSKSNQQVETLDSIIVGVKFKKSQSDGLDDLKTRNPKQVSSEVLELFQKQLQGVTTETLVELAQLKAEAVRLLSLKELIRRGALSEEIANELSNDNFMDVRFEAIKALSDMSMQVSDAVARKALVKNSNTGALSRFGNNWNNKDTSKYDEYKSYLLRKVSLSDLLKMEQECSPYDIDALLISFKMYPKQMSKQMRESLLDGFQSRFDEKHRKIERQFNKLSSPDLKKLADDTLKLKSYINLKHTKLALDILTGEMKRHDLKLVRSVIDKWEIEVSETIMTFFSRFGEWQDVERIQKMKFFSLINFSHSKNYSLLGNALYRIGNKRLGDLMVKIESPVVAAETFRVASQKSINELPDDNLLSLMNSEHDTLRKITAIKCLESLPKSRISSLLEKYINHDDYRYYNVIHWLDLGASMPKTFVKKIVLAELKLN